MAQNLAQKLIAAHLVEGEMSPGAPIAIHIDQTLTQDATGTLVMLSLEAMAIDRVSTEISVQYVDHNLLQTDQLNANDHRFLESACRRFGVWYSRPGNGISHVVHMERFGKPRRSMLGSDSHTPAAGSLGMLAIGAGGLDVAMAMTGEPFRLAMPKIWGVRLNGRLPDWVSAKDVILEMLRRHGVAAGVGKIIEYYGPGLKNLSAMDRHVIANMGAELGATTSVFPSDIAVKQFLENEGRGADWVELRADDEAPYDEQDQIDLSQLEPLIAKPSSPGNVVTVREVAGEPIYQAYIGSSANPGWRDFAIVAEIVRGKTVPANISFDVNPSSREILERLSADGHLGILVAAGARLHQTGCNGCIGMGQAPATGQNSLRTVPRNFPGRSGTREDRVWLCSPETAAASALAGKITDPRGLKQTYPTLSAAASAPTVMSLMEEPLSPEAARKVQLVKGPGIKSLPEFDPLPDQLEIPIILKVGDDISTDEIIPAGARVLPHRSNIEKIAEFTFEPIDSGYVGRARAAAKSGHAVIGGKNYGQGSSREHAAIVPRSLGMRIALVKSFARIHRQNLINYGVLPLTFENPADYDQLKQGDVLAARDLRQALKNGGSVKLEVKGGGSASIATRHDLTPRQVEIVLAGGLVNWRRQSAAKSPAPAA